jgi:hypothetical protein
MFNTCPAPGLLKEFAVFLRNPILRDLNEPTRKLPFRERGDFGLFYLFKVEELSVPQTAIM